MDRKPKLADRALAMRLSNVLDRRAAGGGRLFSFKPPSKPVNVAAIAEAPNNMQQPATTEMPRRNSSSPDSISNSIAATAITAITVELR